MNTQDERMAQTQDTRAAWYRARLRATLDRSRFNGRIHVMYLSQEGYVRAVVERNGMADRWWYFEYTERWSRNTGKHHPALPIADSRAAHNVEWDGTYRYEHYKRY